MLGRKNQAHDINKYLLTQMEILRHDHHTHLMKFESWYAYLGDSASTTGDDTKIIESLVNYCATFLCILLEVFVCVCVCMIAVLSD